MIADVRFVAPDLRRLDEASAEVVACGIYKDERPMRGLAGLLDWRLAGRLSRLAKEAFLVGDGGEVLALPARPRLPFDKCIVVGLGPRRSFDESGCRKALARVLDALTGLSVKKALVEVPGRGDDAITPEQAADVRFDATASDSLIVVGRTDAQKGLEAGLLASRQRTAGLGAGA
jgi:hypothetical protein